MNLEQGTKTYAMEISSFWFVIFFFLFLKEEQEQEEHFTEQICTL